MKKTLLLPTLCLLCLSGIAQSSIISVNFNRSNQLFTTEVAGVEPAANWNHVLSNSQTGTTVLNNLVDNSGSATSTSITTFNAFWYDKENLSSTDGRMFSHYTNTSADTAGTINISGLSSNFTNNGYKVIVYLGGTDSMGENTAAEFGASINSDTQWIRYLRPGSGQVAYDSFSSTTFSSEQDAETSGTNSQYITFEGLTSSDFDLNILPDPDSSSSWARAGV
ncbi:hypothetical protein [Rubritalea tangerina]|uniref:PEP-CTERM sorting domain-containing protein n=1 Tax=Rubritalea tangerina TaxID=430798 RepID=A0ABW4ZF39_9BACT